MLNFFSNSPPLDFRNYLLEDFFSSTTTSPMAMEGGLYLRADSRKGWKRHHFVLRGSGLYYYPKDSKTRSPRDLVCLGLFNDCEVYKGFGWRKKYKAPSDFTFVLHAAHELANSKTTKPLKILCADDAETLERWVLAIRVAKYGKQLWQSYRALREDLARDDFDEMATRRSSSINSFVASNLEATTTVGGGGAAVNGGRPLSRASSSSSSGCLSDENNGFDSEFTTGTIKRKPSMKPNLPLTSMTRQLKEVGENRPSPIGSPERGGTLTRARAAQPNHMRQRSIDSSGSGGSGCSTLKRRPHPPPQAMEKKEMVAVPVTSPLKSMPSCMTDSVFSLPPPPEEEVLVATAATAIDLGSTMSLDSLPPPPSVNELEESLLESSFSSELDGCGGGGSSVQFEDIYSTAAVAPVRTVCVPNVVAVGVAAAKANTPIYAQPKKELESCLKKESIYATKAELRGLSSSSSVVASVTASPVTLRKKVCFEDQVLASAAAAVQSPTKRLTTSSSTSSNSIYGSLPPKPPPRSEGTRLSTQPTNNAAASNNEFLKDLQRVMRKKWQVAQKCKLEPETNPHEVLGFRDFEEWQKQNQLPFYRQSANVSNWVQEHYGPDSLYENLGGGGVEQGGVVGQVVSGGAPVEVIQVIPASKKRPPPLPPKRSETTQLSSSNNSSNNQSPVHQATSGTSTTTTTTNGQSS